MEDKGSNAAPKAGDKVEMITVYRNPEDYPDKFVARKWLATPNGPVPYDPPLFIEDALDDLNAKLNKMSEEGESGLWWLGRDKDDDGCIIGTYLIL